MGINPSMGVVTSSSVRDPSRSKQLRLGVSLSPQSATYDEIAAAAAAVDQHRYDYLWTWDHILAPFGDEDQSIFESQVLMASFSRVTSHVRLGTLVTANTLRHPALLAKMIVTLDHASSGRAVLGLGSGWFEREHIANGLEFGASFGERLTWLGEALELVRRLIDGERVTHQGVHYRLEDAYHLPRPMSARLPILVAGQGEKKTIPLVARFADIWNAKGTPEELGRRRDALLGECERIGRDPESIERAISGHVVIRDDEDQALRAWHQTLEANKAKAGSEPDPFYGSPEQVADQLKAYVAIGVSTFSVSMPAPFDFETIERFIGEVGPLLGIDRVPSAASV
jgi:alkanesulfonate monooxygenase SsuD/methylene tetrahydromethanopterin reductase-like flavin-dependent oxidoreductase (luciferase family)